MNDTYRGSEWRKWDLHFHTPSSYDYGDKTVTNEEIIDVLSNNQISVVAITDHHLIDIERIKKLQKLGKEKRITVLPGIEFLSDAKGKVPIHFIGIFDENCNIEYVWGQLENSTNIKKIKGEGKAHNQVYCDLEDTIKLVKELGGITTIHAGEKSNSIENITHSLPHGEAQKTEIANLIDFYELGKVDDKEGYINIVFPAIKKHIPMIIASDNHNIKKYVLKENCWIKADKTFEGLKQIIYEPEERVRIQREVPESEKLENLIIENIRFSSSNSKFTPQRIFFNKNLNVIIGGKSSGKSILLYEIARTLYANVNDDVLRFKDVEDNNRVKDLYNLSENDINYDFTVELYSKSIQSKKDRQEQSSILPSIKYIPQNHLSNLVDKSRKNGATLKKLIRDLILEDPVYHLKYDDFVGQVKKNDEQRNQDIDFYFSLKNDLQKKQIELQTKGDIKALNEGIQYNKQKIEQLNKDFSFQEQTKYAELTEKLSQLKIKENQINSDFEKIDSFQAELKRYLSELSNKKKILLESLQTINIKNEYIVKLGFIDDALNNIIELSKDFAKNENNELVESSIFFNELSKIKTKKLENYKDLNPYNKKLENQKQVSALQKSISEDEAKIAIIEQFKKEIETTKGAILSQKEKIFKDFKQNYELYEKIIRDLQGRISEVQNETDKVEILPSIKYNFPRFRGLADDVFDGRGFNNLGFEYLYQYWDKNPKSALSSVQYDEIENSLKAIFEKIENKQLLPKRGNSEKDAIKKIFTDFFFDHWDVKSQGDDIHKMSTGKASLVLLKLMIKLSNENGPILIDQPEDNLDNRSVSKELVDFLKDKKRERQIILVTHNPNIVVNADAENIIVANQKGQNDIESTSGFKFDYINGALENTFTKNKNTDLLKSMGIREHIAEIVEGGKEAFKKREEKYGFV